MGYVSREEQDGDSLKLDLDLRACEKCRRELLPWQDTCPDDGGRAVPKDQLAPNVDPLLARFLDEDPPPDGSSQSDASGDDQSEDLQPPDGER